MDCSYRVTVHRRRVKDRLALLGAAANLKKAVELDFKVEPAGDFTPVTDAKVLRELVIASAVIRA